MTNNVALITDLHFGFKSDAQYILDKQREFYENVFFPEIIDRDIKTVICAGDTFDRRKYTNHNTLYQVREFFFDRLQQLGIELHLIEGNHDAYFRDKNEVNSISLLLNDYDNVRVYERAQEVEIQGQDILFVPWICKENQNETFKKIKKSNSPLCIGHFELQGFGMYAGLINEHGHDRKILKDFDLVISGHFHHRNQQGNIRYQGNPYELTWHDYNDPRGFEIMDLDSLESEFIENPYTLFEKITYNDEETSYDDYDISYLDGKGKIVQVVVERRSDPVMFSNFMEHLEQINLIDLSTAESYLNEINESAKFNEYGSGDNSSTKSTIDIIKDHIEDADLDLDKDRMKKVMNDLYQEANSMIV